MNVAPSLQFFDSVAREEPATLTRFQVRVRANRPGLAEVRDAKDPKKLMDLASAAEHYARKARLGEESIQYAHEIKVDAETLLGEFLAADTKRAKKGRPGKCSTEEHLSTLPKLGLSRKESSEAQLLVKLKADAPERRKS